MVAVRLVQCTVILSLLLNAPATMVSAVEILPNPNKEVGIMSSESTYFNCKTDNRQGWYRRGRVSLLSISR